jgi:thiol-disulfide isomerase/thioredoxin
MKIASMNKFTKPLLLLSIFLLGLGSVALAWSGGDKDEKIYLLDFTRKALSDKNTFPWFDKKYNSYHPDEEKVKALKALSGHISALAFGGSWCSDTHEQLPKFYKVMEMAGVAEDNIKLVGVDHQKKSADGLTAVYHIELVPTFILLYDGKEIGRIVESFDKNAETDILAMYQSYKPKE